MKIVRDRWWPHRLGRVLKRTKSSVWVKWFDGEVWRYDKAHVKFLEKANGKVLGLG